MKQSRNYITPFISLVFLVVGITGLLMLFHLFDGYTEVVHEILGLFFVACAVFHIVLNWKALRIHFKKAVFLPASFGVLALSGFLVVMEWMHPPVDLQIMNRLVRAPVEDAFRALNVDHHDAWRKLRGKGVSLENARVFEDLWKHSDTGAEEIIDLLLSD